MYDYAILNRKEAYEMQYYKILAVSGLMGYSDDDIFSHKVLDTYFESSYHSFDDELTELEISEMLYELYKDKIKSLEEHSKLFNPTVNFIPLK